MAERLTVGVRYCGGCNPRFDRVEAVRRLAAACPRAELEGAEPGRQYDLLLIVGGCSACCADRTGLAGRAVVEVRQEQDFDRALALLRRAGGNRRDPER